MKRIILSILAIVAFGCNMSAQDYVYLIKGNAVVAKYASDAVDYVSFTLPEGVIDATDEVDLTSVCFNQLDQSLSWAFPCTLAWDDKGRFRVNRNAGIDFSKLNLVAGESKLKIYKSGTGQIQIADPSWVAMDTPSDWTGDLDVIEETLTQDMIDCLLGTTTDGWSNTAWIIQGDGLTVSKLTLVP